MEVKEIKMSSIRLSESNTRKDLEAGTEEAGLNDLAQSIKERGLLNPVTVRKNDDETYALIAGQRRFLACQKLKLGTIPAIIRDVSDDTDATIISLVENVHRADMHPIDKARAYQKIYEKYRDYNTVAKETGVTIPTIKKYLNLIKLIPSIQEKLTTSDGVRGIEALSLLARIFGPEKQEEAYEMLKGFKQSIQIEMIKRSGGNINKMDGLKEDALAGAFDVHVCHGLDDCSFIPEKLREPIKRRIKDFKKKKARGFKRKT